jgi:hypothetical protein
MNQQQEKSCAGCGCLLMLVSAIFLLMAGQFVWSRTFTTRWPGPSFVEKSDHSFELMVYLYWLSLIPTSIGFAKLSDAIWRLHIARKNSTAADLLRENYNLKMLAVFFTLFIVPILSLLFLRRFI